MNFGTSFDWSQTASISIKDETTFVYENKNHKCAVLIDSKKGTPIASISVEAKDGKTLMSKRGDRNFLSIFEKDGQTLGFRVSNLTKNKIFFVLRHGKEENGKVVNRINLLNGKETIVINGDTSNEERAMKIDKKVDEKTGQGLTVGKAEKTSTPGTYFTFGVAPTVGNEDWRDAVWTPLDFVCFEKEVFNGEEDYCWGSGNVSPSFSPSSPEYSFADSFTFGNSKSSRPKGASSFCFGSGGGGGGFSSASSFSVANDDDIFATNLSHGAVQKISSQEVSIDVKYRMASKTVTLCLSVVDSNRIQVFRDPDAEMKNRLILETAGNFICGKNERLLATITKVYPQEECSICMDASPAYIFVKCGHSCVCKNCANNLREQRCPLCRAFIEAKLDK